MRDKKLLLIAIGVVLFIPLSMATFGGDKFRYPCQNPENWDKDMCKPPICDVTRTCPEHIFKGQRDPRLGPPPAPDQTNKPNMTQVPTQGVNCGK
jgi:hypothetical protein